MAPGEPNSLLTDYKVGCDIMSVYEYVRTAGVEHAHALKGWLAAITAGVMPRPARILEETEA